jgi:hypothetical protein
MALEGLAKKAIFHPNQFAKLAPLDRWEGLRLKYLVLNQ